MDTRAQSDELAPSTDKPRRDKPQRDKSQRARMSAHRRAIHLAAWAALVPVILLGALYLVLLITPIPLPFVGSQARDRVLALLPPSMELELGATSLSLENGVSPAIRFSPVVLVDKSTGGRVQMEALEVGFSPFRTLLGQPGSVITLVAPQLQIIQDLHGRRLARFETLDSSGDDERATVRVLEGESAFPKIAIRSRGLEVEQELPTTSELQLQSDNSWLVVNLESAEAGLREILVQSDGGRLSRFLIRNGSMEIHDSVYGLARTFSDINLDIGREPGTKNVDGTFSTEIAGEILSGSILRRIEPDGSVNLLAQLSNTDFSAFVPFLDDANGLVALHGTGNIVSDVKFAAGDEIKVEGATFEIDLNNIELRIQEDFYPVSGDIIKVSWFADDARFVMDEVRMQAGNSYADVAGVFVFGLDEVFGPTLRMSSTAKNVYIHPNDMNPPDRLYDQMQFVGWSAPLYGAVGIESMVATSGDMVMTTSGRANMLSEGVGLDLDVAIAGASADDLKRMWPYVVGGEARDWFVKNVQTGRIVNSAMKFRFPIGSIGDPGDEFVIPDGALSVDIIASGVSFDALEGLGAIKDMGETRVQVRDGDIGIGFEAAVVNTTEGDLQFSDANLSIVYDDNDTSVFSFNGEVDASIAALLSVAESQSSEFLSQTDVPLDLASLSGNISSAVSAQITLSGAEYAVQSMAFSVDGKVADFTSDQPIGAYAITDGQLAFQVNQNGYSVSGPTKLNGLSINLGVEGDLEEGNAPLIKVSANFAAEDFKEFGFDASEFLGGNVKFTGQPREDGSLKIDVDLTDATLTIADLGLSKPRGEPGTLSALVRFDDPMIDVENIDLQFGTVRLRGGLKYHQEDGLRSANFPSFAMNEGDVAQLTLSPIADGYSLKIRGEQLDLKPLMERFFSLENGGTGGPRATSVDQAIEIDAKLDRALGFYRTTALSLNAQMSLTGETLSRVALQAQFGGSNSLSITTNPVPGGRAMSVAFNDLGTLLRFTGVYPRLAGGTGSLVMNTDTGRDTDTGVFSLRSFSLIDEANVAQILGNHPDSRSLISEQNRVDFNEGRAQFVRRNGRLEITNAVLDGGAIGGTARGYIYTDTGKYDLVGTYIPLFELNNAFQQIPILGPLLGGRDGEGLIGVTFAVRGNLDDPEFVINPASLLVPGVFRSLFEFRTRAQN